MDHFLSSPFTNNFPLAFILLFIFSFILLLHHISRTSRSQGTKSIPGPPGLPILGNLLQLPPSRAWLKFSEWKRQYGDIIYLDIAGQDTVILNTHKAAADLLDRRASIYSDRSKNIVAHKLTGGLVFAFAQHNEVWRVMRRAAHEALNNQAVKNYYWMQETEAVLLVGDCIKDPLHWNAHLRRAATSLVLGVIYSSPPFRNYLDPNIVRVNRFVERALHAAAPGSFLVEYFTWMQYLPRWASPWRRYAEDTFKEDSVMFEGLFKDVQARVDRGDELPSVASTVIHDEKHLEMNDQQAAWLCATLFAAGSETTSGQLSWIMLAMVLYPSTQKKAQAEIDRVVGRGRMPSFRDYEQLTYVRAMVIEILRWRGVGPLAVPHRLCQDNVYDGYLFKKDTIFVANVWELNRDPEVYGLDVDDFNPERHLDESGGLKSPVPDTKDESHYTFGFGRRICIGRHMSKNSMFIQIACLLWAFDITPAKDKNGKEILPDSMDSIDEGLVVRPPEFPCTIKPRSTEVTLVVEEAMELHGLVG